MFQRGGGVDVGAMWEPCRLRDLFLLFFGLLFDPPRPALAGVLAERLALLTASGADLGSRTT